MFKTSQTTKTKTTTWTPFLTLISIVPNADSGHSTHFLGCLIHLHGNEPTHAEAPGFEREDTKLAVSEPRHEEGWSSWYS
jgi:hypothetical protein